MHILLFFVVPTACYTGLSMLFPVLKGNILFRSIFEGGDGGFQISGRREEFHLQSECDFKRPDFPA